MWRTRTWRRAPRWAAVPLGLLVVAGAWIAVNVARSQAESRVTTILAGLQHNLDQVQTLQGTVSVCPAEGDYAPEERSKPQLFWFAMGPLGCCEEEMRPGTAVDRADGMPTVVTSFDGQSVCMWFPASNTASIAHDLSKSEAPTIVIQHFSLTDRYSPRTPPAAKEIAAAEGLRLVGEEAIGDLRCYRLEGRSHQLDCTWWIAPDRGFQVKREDSVYVPPHPTGATVRVRRSRVVEEFTKFEGGIWLPTKIRSTTTKIAADGSETPGSERTFEVVHLTVNEGLGNETFKPRLLWSTKITEEGVPADHPLPGQFGIAKG